ncbi:hypothetical protein BASA81_001192 [Batrachochytrium salamandrivorans]|nr:hypothetical protein BASA81_001192 [Batrachochytrium salamandrivorans]
MVKTFKLCCEMHRMCVVVTLHQARQEIFSLVDTLTVLIGGEMVITGRRPNETFGMLGLGQHVNLGDELLDAMTRLPHLRFENPDLTLVLPSAIPTGQLEKGNDIVEQASLLLSRTIHRGGLDLQTTAGKMALVGGTVICVVCYRDPDAEVLSFERAITLDYILLCGIVFLQGVFVGDRYWRERFAFDFEVSAGVKIHPQSFALSLLARFTVASIVETLCFAVMPIYLLFPWDGTLPQRVAVLVLCGLCTSFQYLVVEILFTKPHDKQTAAHINIAVLALSFLLNGFVISLSDLPVYLSWVPLVVASFWSFSALLTMDLFGKQLDCTRTDVSKLYCLFSGSSGDSVLHALEFDRFTVSESVLALTAIWLAWMALAGLALDRSRGDQRVWVLEDEKEEPILGSKSLRLVGLFVIDLATVLLGVSTGGGGITLVACLAYIALSCHVTWHLAHDSVAVWLTVPIDLILLLLQSHRALLVGAIVVQRANRMARKRR